VSAGYDKRVHLYRVDNQRAKYLDAYELIASEQFASVVEGICFVTLAGIEHLAITRRDSCMIEYLELTNLQVVHELNMNVNKDTWVSFTGVDLAVQPVAPYLLGMATNKSPLGRWLAFEGHSERSRPDDKMVADIYHGAAVSDLGVLQRFAWRPDGSGFFVGSEDGTIYGVSIKTRRVMVTLKKHCGPIRSLWCGLDERGQEVLVSGSFDKTALIWRP
jgi:WD40 repeat protein